MLNWMPRSIWLIAFTAFAYLLQLSPYGLLLYVLMAPLWTIATINAGFLGLGVEALTGRIHKAWLIGPLLWFAGYEYIAWQSNKSVEPLRNMVFAFNDKKQIVFDATTQSLVVETPADTETVRKLLEGYELPVVYVSDRQSSEFKHRAWRISRTESCEAINGSGRFQAPVRGRPMEIHTGRYSVYLPSSCIFGLPEEPTTPVVSYTVEAQEWHRVAFLRYNLTTIKLMSDADTIELRSASVAPLWWFPAPTMGCSFNPGGPSWQCTPDFFRDVRVLTEPSEIAAKALGLKPAASVTLRELEARNLVVRQRGAEMARASQNAFTEFLADPSKPITAANLRDAAKHPEQYDKKSSEIANAIGKVLAPPNPRLDIAINLGEMLAALPDIQFNAVVPQLLAGYTAAQQISTSVIGDRMAHRLSAIGAPALPILERLALEQPDSLTRPIYALCRVGSVAGGDGEEIAKHLRGTKRSDDQHIAAFKTLLRIGRSDLLQNEADADSQYRSDAYRSWRRNITPNGSIDVCEYE
jgi:hypothetical protein